MPKASRSHQIDSAVRDTRFTDAWAVHGPFSEGRAGRTPSCHMEILQAADVPAVIQLHREIHTALPDSGVLYFRDSNFFERLLTGNEGGIVGARARGRLVGYAAFKRAGDDSGSYHRHLNLSGTDPELVAETAGSVVHPEFRNQGLHVALSRTRHDVVRILGYQHIAAVVSLANPAGAATCFRCGLHVRALHLDTDGTNLLFHARLMDHRSPGIPPVERWIELPDTEGHRTVLAAGLRGTAYHRKAGVPLVGYVPPPSMSETPLSTPAQPNNPR